MLRLGYVPSVLCKEPPYTPQLPPKECIINSRNWELWSSLQEQLSLTIVSYQASTYGTQVGNGTAWNGLIGMLLNDTVDITEPVFSETFERHEVVDFPYFPFVVPPSPFLTCERREHVQSSFSLAAIFALEVWLLLFASGFAVFIQFVILMKLTKKIDSFSVLSGSVRQLLETTTGLGFGLQLPFQSAAFHLVDLSWGILLLVLVQGVLSAELFEKARMIPKSPLEDFDTFIANVKSGRIDGIVATGGTIFSEFLENDKAFANVRERIDKISTAERDVVDFTRFAIYGSYPIMLKFAIKWEGSGAIKCYMNDFDLTLEPVVSFAVRKGQRELIERMNRLILRLDQTGILAAIAGRSDARWNSIPIEVTAVVRVDQIWPFAKMCGSMLVFSSAVFLMER